MEKKLITMEAIKQKPHWLKVKLPGKGFFPTVRNLVNGYGLHTVCESALCPNIAECWGAGTATFMILGDVCTRSCRFCAVKTGKPLPLDPLEPFKVAWSIRMLNIKFCVITSVDRDDLPDGGANHWKETILAIKRVNPNTKIETLIPDFKGKTELLDIIISAYPDVISHNIETVARLTKLVRVQAKYERSLFVLEYLKKNNVLTKSGLMVGLGETPQEIYETMKDLRSVGVDILTIGQYLQPTKQHLPVARYVPPEEFEEYKQFALSIGFKWVESGPLVRSSYHAERAMNVIDS